VGARVARRAAVLPLPVRASLHYVAITPVPSTPSRPWSSAARRAKRRRFRRSTKIDSSARKKFAGPRPPFRLTGHENFHRCVGDSQKWRFKIRVIKDWSTVRVERKPFRGVFSERRAPGRHKRDARRNAPCSRPKVTRLRPSHARQRHA
jgi:hypothetical protein